MANIVTRALGFVDVSEDEKYITIGGVKAENIGKDILRMWGTNRIEQHMFNEIGGRVIRFPKFFGPEVHYILSKILNNKKVVTSRGSIKDALALLEQNTWMKRITQEYDPIIDLDAVKLFNKTPMPHQINFFQMYSHRTQSYGLNGYLLSAGAGTGKTLMALILSEMLHADYKVIVCPKNAAYRVWVTSLAEEYKDPRKAWVIADGKAYEGQKYIVCHYEGLEKLKAIAGRLSGRVIIPLDESHNLNSDDSLRTQYFIDICRSIRNVHVLWMSGTPVKALGYESIPLLRSIDPLFTDEVEARFKKIYGRDATKALDILRQRIGMISFHVESSAVVTNETTTHNRMISIPNGKIYTLDAVRTEMQKFIETRLKFYLGESKSFKKTYERALDIYEDTIKDNGLLSKDSEERRAFKTYKRYIELISSGFDPMSMAKEAKYCNHFEKNIIAPTLPKDLKKAFMSAKSVVKYPQLKVLGEALGGVLSKKRVQCHLDMIPHMGLEKIINAASKKTIIFSSYVEVVDAITKYLKGKGFNPIAVHASSGQELSASVNQFFKDPNLNPLVATFQSLSTAVPIICANCTVFTNMPFREYEITQARARTNRLGQDTAVEYYNTYLDTGKEPNVSTRSRDILEWSRQQVAAILGQDYGGTITAEMVNSMESLTEDYTPFEISLAMEEYADF